MKCVVCDTESPSFAWTDSHGIAQCRTCGAPYRIYHYEDGKRVEKPPECLINDESLDLFRACWAACKSPMSAVWLSLSFPGGYDDVAGDGGRAFDKCFAEMEASR